MDQQYKELIAAFLPDGLLNYFDLTQFSQDEAGLRIHLEERNVVPPETEGLIYHSKGFYPEVEIHDFPIRDKKVYLRIKRRHWEIQLTGDIISRDWKLVQAGTRMTAEFAAFLKEVVG